MIRDAEMIQFVEGAFVKLAMEKVGANPPVILDNLNGMVGIMLRIVGGAGSCRSGYASSPPATVPRQSDRAQGRFSPRHR